MGMPEVTIIIICRDRMDLLPEAVASVLSQSVRNIEVLIIHGGDRAVPMAESVSPANPFGDARLRFLSNPGPGNTAEALNFGIKEAKAPWVIWLDAQDRLDPGFLESCLDASRKDPSLSIIYTDLRLPDGVPSISASRDHDFEDLKRSEGIPYRALFSKRAWNEVGGIRTNLEGFNLAKPPLVSVIIPTYNRSDTLKTALESVLGQTFRDFEIIVVSDSGSNELEDLITGLNKRGNITYIRHGANRGLGASRNSGIGASRGKYLAFLDDDDFFFPDHLETLASFLEKTGEKVAYSDSYRVLQEKVDGKYVEYKRDTPYAFEFNYDVILISNYIPVQCFMLARECIREAGGFDEFLSTHEDWDLWIRISRRYRMNRIPRITSAFTHREDGSNMSTRRKANFLDTTIAIYAKYPEFIKDNPAVRVGQARRLADMRREYGLSIEDVSGQRVHPRHAQALERLGQGDADSAIATLKSLVAEGYENARVHADLASAYRRAGRADYAETHFRKSLDLDPVYLPALRAAGEFHFRQGKLSEALDNLRRAYEIDAKDAETCLTLAQLSESVGQASVASQFFRQVLEIDPDNALARERVGEVSKPPSPPG
jgi:glycosyltransferase involved in cell wall biosynthesis